jgi:hypothetical protein
MGWNASWLRHGGSPHGMGAAPDLWQSLGPFLVWSFAVLSPGRESGRLLLPTRLDKRYVSGHSHLTAKGMAVPFGRRHVVRNSRS